MVRKPGTHAGAQDDARIHKANSLKLIFFSELQDVCVEVISSNSRVCFGRWGWMGVRGDVISKFVENLDRCAETVGP